MKKLLSVKYSNNAINFALLILRLSSGILMMNHGYDKLTHFSSYKAKFINLMGIGPTASLSLAVFAEFFCALFIAIGLFTRFAAIPLIITMCVALFSAHHGDFFGERRNGHPLPGIIYCAAFHGPGQNQLRQSSRKITAAIYVH